MNNHEDIKEFDLSLGNRYEFEENAVFLDYTPEILIPQICQYNQQKYQIRLSLAMNLQTVQQILGNDSSVFAKLIQSTSSDHQEIQKQLLNFLVTKMPLLKNQSSFDILVIKPLQNLVQGANSQIKQGSAKLLGDIAHSQKEKYLTAIEEFANELLSNQFEDNKIAGIQILANLSRSFSPQRRQQLFSIQFLKIYAESSVRVKKDILLQLGKIAEYLPTQYVDTYIVKGFFLKETKQNVWGIRNSCIEVIVGLLVKAKTTKEELTHALMSLLKDGNKYVRISAHKIVPEFVANYNEKNVPKSIFNLYLSLIDMDINNQVSKPNQIIQKVSYYFPGVLQVVGIAKWPQMNTLFTRLLHHRNQEVKKPLADSLHVLAHIIGPQLAKQYLFSSFDYMLREPLDSIKLCAIRNLAKFVAQFETSTRESLIDVFLVLQKDPKKWRVRYMMANQMKLLCEIYDADTNYQYLFPISLKLCNDPINQVRICTAQNITSILKQLKSEKDLYDIAIESLLGYSISQKSQQRQVFCIMVENLYPEAIGAWKGRIHEAVSALCGDPLFGVRVALAISLARIVRRSKEFYVQFQLFFQVLGTDQEIKEEFQHILSNVEIV